MKWNLLFISYFSLFCFGMIDNGRGPVYPYVIGELGAGPVLASYTFLIASLGSLIATFKAPWWQLKFSILGGLRLALIFMGLGSCVLFISPHLPQIIVLPSFFFGSFIFGIGGGLSGVAMNILISKATPIEYQRKAYAGLHSCYGIASFLAPLLVNFVMLKLSHWSYFFLLAAIIPLVIGLFVFPFISKEKFPPLKMIKYKEYNKRSDIVLLALMFALYVSSEILVSSRMVYFLVEGLGYSSFKANNFLSYFFIGLLSGRVLFAILKERGSHIFWPILLMIFSILSSLLGLIYHPLFLSLTGLFMSGIFPTAMGYLSNAYRKDSEFHLDGIISYTMLYIMVGIILLHFISGYLSSHFGIKATMLMVPIYGSLALMCFLISIRKLKKIIA